ncbi:MAG: response regulator [Candidatus Pacebacteria bacterium]|nr:response regulator [Candidatus Paceibacterota bacterium]
MTQKIKILLVEDCPYTSLLVQKVLAAQGHEVLVMENATDVIKNAGDYNPDILVTDNDLGFHKDAGLLLTEHFTRCRPEMPIIFMSGRMDLDLAREAGKAGADVSLPKPFTPDELIASLTRAMLRIVPKEPKQPASESKVA